MKQLAVFASGNGSNFEAIVNKSREVGANYFVKLLVCDQSQAFVLERAKRLGVQTYLINYKDFARKSDCEVQLVEELNRCQIEFIALAGYMKLIGDVLLNAYPNQIINIHPSLLPSFKGLHAIKQAYNDGVKVMGVTIHYVNQDIDSGLIIAHDSMEIESGMTLEMIEASIHEIEHRLYPRVLNELLGGAYETSINQCVE